MVLFLLIETLTFCLSINSFFIKIYYIKIYKNIIRTENKKYKNHFFYF